MKKLIGSYVLLFSLFCAQVDAQDANVPEKFGKTLNLGLGLGYYGYVGHPVGVLHADFEFDIAKNITIAPFITLYTYQNNYYWGDPNHDYRNYSYHETVIPVGAKVCYYFDQLLKAGPKWDFYVGTSIGFEIRTYSWENGYNGVTNINQGRGLYAEMHLGSEYHFSKGLGFLVDLSTGVSTVGLGIHF